MNNNYLEVNIENIEVFCVSTEGVRNSASAFSKLEAALPNLKGRKFYGVLSGNSDTGIYRACVVSKPSENIGGLEKWIIPGGKYIRAKIKDWEKHVDLIAPAFSDMTRRYKIDNSRPSIEYYRSQKELLLLFPVK